MTGSSEIAPADPSGGGFLRHSSRQFVLPALTVAAAGAAAVVLASQANDTMLDCVPFMTCALMHGPYLEADHMLDERLKLARREATVVEMLPPVELHNVTLRARERAAAS